MSIVPFGGGGSTSSSDDAPLDAWWGHPESLFDLWDPLFPFSPILRSAETQVNWRETQQGHVFRAVFSTRAEEVGVLVYIDDDDFLQIGTEDGKFATRFKLPEDAVRDGVKASVDGGVLTVTVPKVGAGAGGGRRGNVRSVEITGSE